MYPFLFEAERDIFIYTGVRKPLCITISTKTLKNNKSSISEDMKGELIMSVEMYALFSYAFTAAIALVMIGAVVLLNKVMGGGNDEGGME